MLTAHRGAVLHFLQDPRDRAPLEAFQYFDDGLLVLEGGTVREVGPAKALLKRLPREARLERHPGDLLLPGFVDCHVHFPQIEIIAAYGEQLLDWLNRHAYPAESRFHDGGHARRAAKFFLGELLRNGTTTAMVFATVHPESVEALFAAASALRLRLISGKTLMDRNAPESLLDTPRSGLRDSRRLIERWHGKGRLSYALTPRFAPTSSEEQLKTIRRLRSEFPDVYLQTHLSENLREVEWVARLYPRSKNYLDVYDGHGLTGRRSLFAHCVHLSDAEWRRLSETGSAAAFCPSSNLFLGSGLFDLEKAAGHRARIGIGTDVGAGTSLSLLRNLDEAYKIVQLRSQRLSPLEAFYLATLGGARALSLDDKIGNFLPGKEADFIVLDPAATPLSARRAAACPDIADRLFLLMTLGDDRAVRATYVLGEKIHDRDAGGDARPPALPAAAGRPA